MTQESVLEFLARAPTAGAAAPQRIDTHAASVFLFPDHVLKIKRAVRFPFLDYSTLAQRKAACDAELAVNHPFAPQIYRRVAAITKAADGALAIDGAGEPVEWAVEMARFNERDTLDHLADSGGIDDALADALGRAVTVAHAKAPPVDPAPWIAAVGGYIDEHDAAFRAAPDLFPVEAVTSLTTAMRKAYDRVRPLLVARGERGLIRRCHGDLHLGNIVRIDGRPVLFDAIEFSELIASGDVLYDLAFLLMDLHGRGLAEAANVTFNRYLGDTHRDDDLDALAVLPFYLSMRAAIRAKVTAARIAARGDQNKDAESVQARRYFDLALDLISPPAPKLIAVGGLSGTGKSVLARKLAPRIAPAPGAVLLRSDVERKRMFDTPETEHLPTEAYATEVTATLYAALSERAARVVAAGHSAVVDAVFARLAERDALAEVGRRTGVTLHGLFLTAPLSLRLQRVGARVADASDADARIVAQQEGYELGALDWAEVEASGGPQETLQHALAALESRAP